MDIVHFIKKASKRLIKVSKLNRIMYKLSKSDIIYFDENAVTEARAFLENYSPNPKTSCICKNKIDPQVDIHIIIPAYNVECYIEECMNSIVRNPTKKYTYLITVINDGSTDKTSEILEKYKETPCVEIITQENKGFSGARNTGLSHIKGKYVLFVDSDDFMDWQGVEKMVDTALEKGADVVRGAYTRVSDNGGHPQFIKNVTGKMDPTKLGGQPWAKLFRSEIFSDICFPERYWYEDSIFAQIVFPRISLAYGIAENTYFYRNRASGISNQGIKKPKAIDSYWITERLFEERSQYGLTLTTPYYEHLLRMMRMTFSRISLQPYEVKRNLFILFCDFFSKHFTEFPGHNAEYKELEEIIRTKDLGRCIAYATWLC